MQAMTFALRQHRVLGGATRSRLLAVLRRSDTSMSVRELAADVGLHPNTVREQLDQLVGAGLVFHEVTRSAGRGRPSLRYTANAEAENTDPNAYRALATALANQLAESEEVGTVSINAGERWGRALVAEMPAATSTADAVAQLVDLLDDAGFAPDTPVRPGDPIRLRHCPFGSLTRDRRDVVCGVHLGLMRGALSGLEAPLSAVRLEPFVAPNLCLAHLEDRTDG